MEAKFYVRELDSFDLNGKKKETSKVLFFRMVKASIGDPNAAPFEFDDRATEKHKQTYSAAFGQFLEELKESGETDWDKIEGLDVKQDDPALVSSAPPENVQNAAVDGGWSNETAAEDENGDNPKPLPVLSDLPESDEKEQE